MKKFFGIILLLISLTIVSCGPEKGEAVGVITDMTDKSITVSVGDESIKYDITETNFNNGAVLPGDSVKVMYITGIPDSKHDKAIVISLIEKKGIIISAVPDSTKELVTIPDTVGVDTSED